MPITPWAEADPATEGRALIVLVSYAMANFQTTFVHT
jgi:hypothetical protein